jgi:glycosyltransferase involved in cell wall biosynthesis
MVSDIKKMKKHVCMIAYTNYPSDARVRREAETLVSTGEYEVSFLALRGDYTAKSYELENVKVIELNVHKYRGQNKFYHFKSYMKFLFLAFFRCNKLFFSRQLDIIHVHNMPNFLVLAGILPRLFGKKMILDIHDSTPETYFARYGRKSNQLIFKILCWEEAIFCGVANKVICVNHVQRDELVKRGIPAQKVVISMNVPDPKWFKTSNTIKDKKHNDKIKLIYHGTIAKRLGIDLAIRAFAKICNAASGMEFYILGDGEGIDECEELSILFNVDDSVHFSKKMLPLESLLKILEDMDIGIIANRENPATELMLPVKLLEYISLNIPVVAPRLRAIEYYFTDEMVTYFEPENVDSLAQAILNLYNDESRRKVQAEKAKVFLEQYGWEKHRLDLINLYREI